MENNNFKKAIAEALIPEYETAVPIIETHTFSPRFENNMEKLIGRRNKPYYMLINTAGKRAAGIIIGVIIASAATIISVDALREGFIDFFTRIFSNNSIVRAENTAGAPEKIEDIYEITYDLSGYTVDYEFYDKIFGIDKTYKKGDIIIHYSQSVKSLFDTSYNTEGAELSAVDINGFEAVYYCDRYNYHHLIWDNGDYIISLGSNIGKNELIEIAESVQKAE